MNLRPEKDSINPTIHIIESVTEDKNGQSISKYDVTLTTQSTFFLFVSVINRFNRYPFFYYLSQRWTGYVFIVLRYL